MSDDQALKKQQFQNFINTTPIGTLVEGTVAAIYPFGVFVKLDDIPFNALIEIVLSKYHPGTPLPYDQEEWPKNGERIRCSINYFRENNCEIGIGWLPE